DLLFVDALEPVLLHLGERPRDRSIEARAPAQAVADPVAQVGEAVVRRPVAERGADEAFGRLAVDRRDRPGRARRLVRLAERLGERRRERERREEGDRDANEET